jgi:hypothetical protein
MIGYVTVGTNDLGVAARFYDAIAAEMGVGRMMEFDNFIAWGTPGGAAGIAATKPFDGNAASVGNGVMVAFEAKDQAQVDRLYAIALALNHISHIRTFKSVNFLYVLTPYMVYTKKRKELF